MNQFRPVIIAAFVVILLSNSVFCQLVLDDTQQSNDRLRTQRQLMLLNNRLNDLEEPEFAEALGLVDSQIAEFKAVRIWLDSTMSRVMIPDAEILDKAQFEKDWVTATAELNERRTSIKGILLPHQKDSYRKIELLRRLGLRKSVRGFSSPELADQLGLTKEQKKKIKEIDASLQSELDEEQKELQSRIHEINQKYAPRSFATLNKERRKKYKQELGEPVEVKK